MNGVGEIERPAELMLSPLENEAREKLCDEMARRFGQVAIRYRHGEIPQNNFDELREIYFRKMHNGQVFEGEEREAELAKFDQRVDNMWLLAQADIWEAKAELGCDDLPEFTLPTEAPLDNDELLHNNLELTEDNHKLVEALGAVWRRARKAEKDYDDLLAENRRLRERLAVAGDPVETE